MAEGLWARRNEAKLVATWGGEQYYTGGAWILVRVDLEAYLIRQALNLPCADILADLVEAFDTTWRMEMETSMHDRADTDGEDLVLADAFLAGAKLEVVKGTRETSAVLFSIGMPEGRELSAPFFCMFVTCFVEGLTYGARPHRSGANWVCQPQRRDG